MAIDSIQRLEELTAFPIMPPVCRTYRLAVSNPESPAMKTQWELTEESFNLFLSWLATDRDVAAKKYEELRRRLVQLFYNRGCPVAEDLADETFNRVMRRLPDIIEGYIGAPAAYIHGTAHNVFLDYLKKRNEPLPEQMAEPVRAPESQSDELIYACLERCIVHLTPQNRELVIQYYQENKRAKIEHRKQLAERLGLAVNALRIRLCRLRLNLQQCIEDCLEKQAQVGAFAFSDEMD